MSLRQLDKQIQACARDMDQQRQSTCQLLQHQHSDLQQQIARVPIPVALGLACAAGFIAQRFFNYPNSTQLVRFALSMRTW